MGANNFIPLPPIPAGASGLQVSVDLATIVPPTGLDEHMTIICKGDFVDGYIAIMGSPDGVNYDVLTQFTSGGDADGAPGPALEFSPRTIDAIVRFVRADVRATVRGPLPTQITIGGEAKCDCISGGITPTQPACSTMTLDEDGEREVTGSGEQLVEEWFVDFLPLFPNGPSVLALFSGIFETLTIDDSFWRVRLGSSAPGVIDGAIIDTIQANAGAGTFTASTGTLIANPAFSAQLVQVTIEPGAMTTQDAFIRGFLVQFTCVPPF